MSEINKNIKTPTETLVEIGQQVGLVLMTAAATVGMVDMPNHEGARIALPSQPTFARVIESEQNNNPLRREREESAPHYISYNVTQRTPGRSGSIK